MNCRSGLLWISLAGFVSIDAANEALISAGTVFFIDLGPKGVNFFLPA